MIIMIINYKVLDNYDKNSDIVVIILLQIISIISSINNNDNDKNNKYLK